MVTRSSSSSCMALTIAIMVAIMVCMVTARPQSYNEEYHPQPDHFNTLGAYELLAYNPVANAKAVVISGNARFTILTPRLIRMEYSPKAGVFEDRATPAVVNRNVSVPWFTSSVSSGVLTIITDKVTLTYTVGAPFSSSSLRVTSRDVSSQFKSWYYGQSNHGNLLGTIRSLDELGVVSLNCTENANIRVHSEVLHCEWGLISRDGWSVVDDSKNYVLNKDTWWDGPSPLQTDIYLFAHGYDYRGAIYDYTLIGGKIAMVPRYASGIWWSRWYDISSDDTKKIVHDYSSRGLPLDVYILDMNWHSKEHWGGYTFDSRLWPYPKQALQWLAHYGLVVGANLHDDDGVHDNEAMHDPLARALGLDPKTCGTIPFNIVNQTMVYSLEDIVLKNVEDLGMTIWWIDWQQGGTEGGATGDKQNPTIWLDKVRCTNNLRRGDPRRGITLARWGGLGNHRYQVGFSGDVDAVSWKNLAYQPYFSLTAANVAYPYWSHDLVGPHDDHELHTRWLQWGAFSGVFRTHDRGMAVGDCADKKPTSDCAIIEPWNVPNEYFEANRIAMVAREELLPYIYTQARAAYDTGVGLLFPMYYNWPQIDAAYSAATITGGQYMFGPDMFVRPIVVPADATTGLARTDTWVPPGVWIQSGTHALIQGDATTGTVLSKAYHLQEIPIFVRSGAITTNMPVGGTAGTIALARRQYSALVFVIWPGATGGNTAIYEDDGATVSYVSGVAGTSAWTRASYVRSSNQLTFKVFTDGTFPLLPTQRRYVIRIINSIAPSSVTVNGVNIPWTQFPTDKTWWYEGSDVSTLVDTGLVNTKDTTTIVVNWDIVINDKVFSGIAGGIRHATLAKRLLDETWGAPGSQDTTRKALLTAAATGESLGYIAGTDRQAMAAIINGFAAQYGQAIDEVKSATKLDPTRQAHAVAILVNGMI